MVTTRPLVVDSRIRQSTNSDVLIQAQTQIPASTPAAPAAGNVIMSSQTVAGKTIPAFTSETGNAYRMGNASWDKIQFVQIAQGNALTSNMGSTFGIPLGTKTYRNYATGSQLSLAQRVGVVSAATAGSLSALQAPTGFGFPVGNGSYGGGFVSMKFMFSDAAAVAGARAFVGIQTARTNPTNVEPSTLTFCMGVAQLSTDNTQLYLVYGGYYSQAPIPLGTGFPPMTGSGINAGPYYNLIIQSPPNVNGQLNWTLQRIDTGTSISGTVTDTTGVMLPGFVNMLYPILWRCNNATALAVGLDIATVMAEFDV